MDRVRLPKLSKVTMSKLPNYFSNAEPEYSIMVKRSTGRTRHFSRQSEVDVSGPSKCFVITAAIWTSSLRQAKVHSYFLLKVDMMTFVCTWAWGLTKSTKRIINLGWPYLWFISWKRSLSSPLNYSWEVPTSIIEAKNLAVWHRYILLLKLKCLRKSSNFWLKMVLTLWLRTLME